MTPQLRPDRLTDLSLAGPTQPNSPPLLPRRPIQARSGARAAMAVAPTTETTSAGPHLLPRLAEVPQRRRFSVGIPLLFAYFPGKGLGAAAGAADLAGERTLADRADLKGAKALLEELSGGWYSRPAAGVSGAPGPTVAATRYGGGKIWPATSS